jgi:hypothetical protein
MRGMARIEGELAQAKGADGARRAKRWLESTTRVNAQWVNPDPPALKKLQFSWPFGGQNFSFDLGGTLRYGDFEGEMFYAESKNYDSPSDLSSHYSKFLAQCYVAYLQRPAYCDHFMWISWSPHSVTRWSELTSASYVKEHVLKNKDIVFGVDNDAEAQSLINDEKISAVAERLWLIVLSRKQEALVISKEHRGLIEKHEIEKEEPA